MRTTIFRNLTRLGFLQVAPRNFFLAPSARFFCTIPRNPNDSAPGRLQEKRAPFEKPRLQADDTAKVFVEGLPSGASVESVTSQLKLKHDELAEIFLLKDRMGNATGRAIVTFSDPAHAQKYLSNWVEGGDEGNKHLIVRAYERGAGRKQVPTEFPSNEVYVANLNYTCTEQEFTSFASQFGKVSKVSFPAGREGSSNRGFGFVTFETEEDAKNFIAKANESEYMGRNLNVKPRGGGSSTGERRPYRPRREGGAGRFDRGEEEGRGGYRNDRGGYRNGGNRQSRYDNENDFEDRSGRRDRDF